jgi:hypothetical protein
MLPIYEQVVRIPNIMKHRNPLAQTVSKTVTLADRMLELQSAKKWQKLVQEYQQQGIKIDPKLRPLVKMVKLGCIEIDEDIQRELDCGHCTKIAAVGTFNPSLLQVIYCVKIPGAEEFTSCWMKSSIP